MILMNDQFITRGEAHIDIEDRGYQFGDGIYEVVRVYDGKPFRFDDHLIRFERSAKELSLSLPLSSEEIKLKITQLIEMNNLQNGIVYFQTTRGVATRNHAFPTDSTSVLTAYTKEMNRPYEKLQKGIKIVTIEDIRWLRCDIKSLNLLGNIMAKQYAVDHQAYEAVQIRDNIVTEGSSSNFFIVKDGKILTHPANNFILKGITRLVIEKIADKIGIPFVEKEFNLKQVYQADEAFVSSTTMEIMPINQINDKTITNSPGSITKALQEEFEKLIKLN
ncbi:D-amino-acid transaminase [Tepidibacillus infernus]|uniref:D-alanine aminotransferase n=1 Tax=Tepidibacillus decaturensis TaxID=1413211 RepID=A0A135L2T4_9BACI|nr:D-amino-acid transaminase [Tepidibacillus decaturensis]KXG43260.1 D-alanine aminotransferase [Tepidibacillus decaturensis]